MDAKMLSPLEHVAGGQITGGISLHTADGGKTYTTKGAKIKGMMVTSMSFITKDHALATAVNALQICSLLELGA